MKQPIFAASYAQLYDAMYAGKDYARECDALEAAVRRFGDGGAYRTLLDLGCGTGNHALPLARRGFEVTGVDLSPDMVAIAQHKAAAAGVRAAFSAGDMRSADTGRAFDLVLIMFAALGYQTEDEGVAAALANARRHLRPGGLLMLDVWNGPTVVREGARDRIGVVDGPGRQMIKASMRTLQRGRPVVDVRVRVWQIEGRSVTGTADESHRMRFFFQPELEALLPRHGFAPRLFFDFPDLDRPVGESTFDLGCVATALAA